MTLYFMINRYGERLGPMTADELMHNGLTYDSPVWHEGLTDWVEASEVYELRSILDGNTHSTPPPPPIKIMGERHSDSFSGESQPNENGYDTPHPDYGHQPNDSPYRQTNGECAQMPQMMQPYPKKPSNYLAIAILSTLLCCLPFGVISIIYAAQVDGQWNSGQYDKAYQSSRKAKNWAIAAVATSLIVSIIYFIFFSFAAAIAAL